MRYSFILYLFILCYCFSYAGNGLLSESPTDTADKFTMGTPSNCYILTPGGHTIAIPVSRANAFAPQLGKHTPFTACLLWNDGSAGLVTLSKSAGTGFEDHICVTSTSDVTKSGNAVVAIKDCSGKILWSWHIWVTGYKPDRSATFMDRNLGATSANPKDGVATFGLCYQWGRKDPFPGNASTISGCCKEPTLYTSSGTGFTFGMNANADAELGYPTRTYNQQSITWTIQHPGTYIANSESWYPDARLSDDPWGNYTGKTIYDPCPEGWRVPKDNPWFGLSSPKKNSYWSDIDKGSFFPSHGGWYPALCRRNHYTGQMSEKDKGGYWTARLCEIKSNQVAYAWFFDCGKNGISLSGTGQLGNGYTVRCTLE